MALILSTAPGRVFRFDEPQIPMSVGLQGFGPALNAALTAVGFQPQANVQFAHSLKRVVYAYTFGERIADLQVSGVLFPGQCDGDAPSGFENMLGYYGVYGIARRGAPVALAVGNATLEGLLVGGRLDVTDPQTGVGAFSLLLKVFADDALVDARVTGVVRQTAGAGPQDDSGQPFDDESDDTGPADPEPETSDGDDDVRNDRVEQTGGNSFSQEDFDREQAILNDQGLAPGVATTG